MAKRYRKSADSCIIIYFNMLPDELLRNVFTWTCSVLGDCVRLALVSRRFNFVVRWCDKLLDNLQVEIRNSSDVRSLINQWPLACNIVLNTTYISLDDYALLHQLPIHTLYHYRTPFAHEFAMNLPVLRNYMNLAVTDYDENEKWGQTIQRVQLFSPTWKAIFALQVHTLDLSWIRIFNVKYDEASLLVQQVAKVHFLRGFEYHCDQVVTLLDFEACASVLCLEINACVSERTFASIFRMPRLWLLILKFETFPNCTLWEMMKRWHNGEDRIIIFRHLNYTAAMCELRRRIKWDYRSSILGKSRAEVVRDCQRVAARRESSTLKCYFNKSDRTEWNFDREYDEDAFQYMV
jgi:hypothetical protein